MAPEQEKEKNPFIQNTEFILKLGTAILGVLYVLGLMISNAQLMELGIADFASLQTRNIMIGLLFIIYVMVLVVLLAPISAILPVCAHRWTSSTEPTKRKLLYCLGLVIAFIVITASVAVVAGSFIGYLYPWGKSWSSHLDFSPSALYGDFISSFAQLHDPYFRIKIGVCCVIIIVIEAITIKILLLDDKKDFLEHISEISSDTFGPVPALIIFIFLIISYITFILFDYAGEVYPNLRYNLGGGQPQIAELQIGGDDSVVDGLPIVGPPSTRDDKQKSAVKTDAVAIWYQSEKFLYLSRLTDMNQATARVVALDLKMVRAIRYLPKYIKVASGGRVLSIHSY